MSRALLLALALTAASPALAASGQCTPFDLDPASAEVTEGRRPDGGLGPDSSICCKEGLGCERRCPNCTQVSQPVDTLSGFAWLDRTDVSLDQPWGPRVEFARHYATSLAERGAGSALGPGWTHTYSAMLVPTGPAPAARVWLFLGALGGEEYTLAAGGYTTTRAGRTLAYDALTHLYLAQRPDGSTLVFDAAGALKVLRSADGGEAQLRYAGDDAPCAVSAALPAGALCRVDFLFDRQLWFSYTATGALAWVAHDAAGTRRAVTLSQNPDGTLQAATAADGAAETYSYGFTHQSWATGATVSLLLQATDADGKLVESFAYAFNHDATDGPARVVGHSTPEASYSFAWDYLDLDTLQVVRKTRVRSNRENLDLTFANNAVASACVLDAAGACDVSRLHTYVQAPGLQELLCEREGSGRYLRHERDAQGRITAEYAGLATCDGVTPEAAARSVAYGYLGSTSRRVSRARATLDPTAPGFQAFTVLDFTSPAAAVDPRCGTAACQRPDAYNAGAVGARGQRRVSMGRTLVDPDGTWGLQVLVTTYGYDGSGRLVSVDGPRTGVADVSTYQWSATLPWALEAMTPAGRLPTRFAGHDLLGNAHTVTGEGGEVYSFEHDPVGRLTSRQVPGQATPTTYSYLPSGRLQAVQAPGGAVHTYAYDADGQLQTEQRLAEAGSTQPDVVRTYQRTLKRVQSVTVSEATPTVPIPVATAQVGYGYDSQGRATRTLSPGPSGGSALGYDDDGRLAWRSDPGRFQAGAQDPVRSQQYERDAYGQLLRVTQLVGGAWLEVARYGWDTRGNLASFTDAKGVTVRYQHDDFGRLVEVESPDLGLRRYLYDEAGNLVKERRPDGTLLAFQYDAAGRLAAASLAGGATLETRTYDGATPALVDCAGGAALPASRAQGRLTHVQDAAGDWYLGYTPGGRLAFEALVLPGATCARTLRWEYGPDGLLSAQGYPSGARVEYRYPAAGQRLRDRPTALDLVVGGVRTPLLTNLVWAQNEVVAYTTPGGDWRLSRRQDRSPSQVDALATGTRRQEFSGLDGWGNPGLIQETVWAQRTPAQLQTLVHDDLPSLAAAAGPGTAPHAYATLVSGDRKAVDGVPWCYEAGTHRLALVAGQSRFTYLADGAVSRRYDADGTTTTWCQGPRGELAAVVGGGGEVSQVVTSFRGQRVAELWPLNGLREDFRVDQESRLLVEAGAASLTAQYPRPTREYVWLGEHPVAVLESTEAAGGAVTAQGVTYLFSGQLGEVLVEADAAGTVQRQYALAPFGARVELAPPTQEVLQAVALAALPGFGPALWGQLRPPAGTRAVRLRFPDAALAGCTVQLRDENLAWVGEYQVHAGDQTAWHPGARLQLMVSGCSAPATASIGVTADLGGLTTTAGTEGTAHPYPAAGQRLSLTLPTPAYLRVDQVDLASCDRLEARDASGAVLWQWKPAGLDLGVVVLPDTTGITSRLQGTVELGIWGNGCNGTELKAGFTLSAILAEPQAASRPPVSLGLPGQKLRSEGTADSWYRLYAPDLGRYLSPDPALLWPSAVVSAGLQAPGLAAYAYAANRPLVLVDPDGRIIDLAGASERLRKAVEVLKNSKCGKDLWDRLEKSPIIYKVREASLGTDRGDPIEGLVSSPKDDYQGPRLPPEGTVDVQLDFPNHDKANATAVRRQEWKKQGVQIDDPGEVTSDAFLVGHEFDHGLDYLDGYPPKPKDEDEADRMGKCVCEGK